MISSLRPFTVITGVTPCSLAAAACYRLPVKSPLISPTASSFFRHPRPRAQAAYSPNTAASYTRRTLATMATQYRLKLEDDLNSLKNGHKVEVEIDGIEGAKVLLLKVDGSLRVLNPRCTRTYLLHHRCIWRWSLLLY